MQGAAGYGLTINTAVLIDSQPLFASGRTHIRKAGGLRYSLAVVLGITSPAVLAWFLAHDAGAGPDEAQIDAMLNTQMGGKTIVVSTNRDSFALPARNNRLSFPTPTCCCIRIR